MGGKVSLKVHSTLLFCVVWSAYSDSLCDSMLPVIVISHEGEHGNAMGRKISSNTDAGSYAYEHGLCGGFLGHLVDSGILHLIPSE